MLLLDAAALDFNPCLQSQSGRTIQLSLAAISVNHLLMLLLYLCVIPLSHAGAISVNHLLSHSAASVNPSARCRALELSTSAGGLVCALRLR